MLWYWTTLLTTDHSSLAADQQVFAIAARKPEGVGEATHRGRLRMRVDAALQILNPANAQSRECREFRLRQSRRQPMGAHESAKSTNFGLDRHIVVHARSHPNAHTRPG